MRSGQHFLVDSELEKTRHKTFSNAMQNIKTTIINGTEGKFFNNIKRAIRLNQAFGFILKEIEDERFRYFYAHENDTQLERSNLLCTKEDLAKLKDLIDKINLNGLCSREKLNTKWRFY